MTLKPLHLHSRKYSSRVFLLDLKFQNCNELGPDMIIKNLYRRKARTTLTIFGISIGVAAIIALGALANGLEAGYSNMMSGSKADLILSQPNTIDVAYSSIDETVGKEIQAMPEVEKISAMLEGYAKPKQNPSFLYLDIPRGVSFLIVM
jgi:ABC-type antimicrobial peptide transport system permease subunit